MGMFHFIFVFTMAEDILQIFSSGEKEASFFSRLGFDALSTRIHMASSVFSSSCLLA